MNENGTPLAVVEDVLPLTKIVERCRQIDEVMTQIMKKGVHYGTIPGCGPKPTLLLPGAEKLCSRFRLAPEYIVERFDLVGGHREYEIGCKLTHIPTNQVWGWGVGCCSTLETKYRYRQGGRKCPECGEASIIKSKFGHGGWLCFEKKGGCGAKWKDGAKEIEGQDTGRIENPDPADQFNTVKKMAKKRALVDAVKTALGCSDIFTQDVEDMPGNGESESKPEAAAEPEKKTPPKKMAGDEVTRVIQAAVMLGITQDQLEDRLAKPAGQWLESDRAALRAFIEERGTEDEAARETAGRSVTADS